MAQQKKGKLSEHVRERTREWFRKAEHDLIFLENAHLEIDDPPTDTTGKLAHMVAEYSLKAFLVLNKVKVEKTHDLRSILDDCIALRQDKDFEALRSDCIDLTRYRTELTYPAYPP